MNKQYLDAFSKVAPEKAKDLCGQARYLQAFGEAATGKAHSLLRQSRFISIGDTLSSLPSKPMTFKKACAALDTKGDNCNRQPDGRLYLWDRISDNSWRGLEVTRYLATSKGNQ